MHERIVQLRKTLQKRLEAKTQPGFWKNIIDQVGFFAFTGLSGKSYSYFHTVYSSLINENNIRLPTNWTEGWHLGPGFQMMRVRAWENILQCKLQRGGVQKT